MRQKAPPKGADILVFSEVWRIVMLLGDFWRAKVLIGACVRHA
jgi:hypothetical protein